MLGCVKRLRIGVDARPLTQEKTGIGRCTGELLRRLLNTEHDWFLYSDKPLAAEFSQHSNVTVRSGRLGGRVGGLIYSQLFFPVWAKRDQLDVFWSPRHHLPVFLSTSIPAVVSIYDLVWKHCPETMTKLGWLQERILMPYAIRRAAKVLAVSDFTQTQLLESFPQVLNKVVVVPAAASITEFLPVGQLDDDDYFLFVGTLEPRKNLALLLKAYADYRFQAGQPVPLKIVGSGGWGGVNLQALIAKYQLQDVVELIGQVSDAELQSLYSRAYALLMPSKYEGFGLPVVEAMHYGVPALVSQDSSLAEVAGKAGLLVDPFDVFSISAGISLIAKADVRASLAMQTKNELSKYSWDTSASSTLAVIASSH